MSFDKDTEPLKELIVDNKLTKKLLDIANSQTSQSTVIGDGLPGRVGIGERVQGAAKGALHKELQLPECCPHCGECLEIDPQDRTCNHCGKKVEPVANSEGPMGQEGNSPAHPGIQTAAEEGFYSEQQAWEDEVDRSNRMGKFAAEAGYQKGGKAPHVQLNPDGSYKS